MDAETARLQNFEHAVFLFFRAGSAAAPADGHGKLMRGTRGDNENATAARDSESKRVVRDTRVPISEHK